jgi:hypothetical protein
MQQPAEVVVDTVLLAVLVEQVAVVLVIATVLVLMLHIMVQAEVVLMKALLPELVIKVW